MLLGLTRTMTEPKPGARPAHSQGAHTGSPSWLEYFEADPRHVARAAQGQPRVILSSVAPHEEARIHRRWIGHLQQRPSGEMLLAPDAGLKMPP